MEETIATDNLPDAALISRIIGGEKRLFELVMRRYNQRLFRIGMSVLNSDTETEDAMQVAYINAYEHLHQFEHRSSLGTWLTRIMLNECLAQKKKQQHHTSVMETQNKQPSGTMTPGQALANKELSHILEDAIARLPEKYRLVFVLREIEELSVKETGEALTIAETNVKVRLNRAKTMLRDRLSGYMKSSVYSFHLTRCDRIVNRVFAALNIG